MIKKFADAWKVYNTKHDMLYPLKLVVSKNKKRMVKKQKIGKFANQRSLGEWS